MPDPQFDPLAEFYNAKPPGDTGVTPPPDSGVAPPSGGESQDPLSEFYNFGKESAAPTPDMTPKVFPPPEKETPVLGLPQELDLPFFGKTRTTDIPLAGFFLNQRMYQGPTEQEQAQYKPQKEEVYNPLQPLGINAPISSTTPVLGGIAEAIGEAQRPTTPDYFSAGIRDKPIIGEASRAGEAALGLLGQSFRTIGEPLAGLVSIPARGLSKAGEGWDAMKNETQKAADEALARINAAGGLDRPKDMAQELGVLQEFGRSALAGTPAVYKFAAPMLFDPLTYAGGGLSKAERAKLGAGATMDVADIAKMSTFDRITKTGYVRAPVSAEEIRKAGEMGVLSKQALGMVPNAFLQKVLPWVYTDRSKAMELLENSISGLLARSQFTDASKTQELLEKFAQAAKENSFAPIKDAFPDMEKAARSFEGQRIIRSLGELDVKRSKAILEGMPDMINEAREAIANGYKLGPKPSQFVKDLVESLQAEAGPKGNIIDAIRKRYGTGTLSDEQLTTVANEWAKYKMLVDASDTMGKAAIDAFKISPDERLAVKVRDTIKSLEANLFIGFSPSTVINNWGNNTIMQALHGLNPFGISKSTDRMWKAWGMEPGGEFRRIQEATLAKISKDTRSAGFAGLVKGRQFGPFLGIYSKMENGARHNIWAKGVEDYFKRAMKDSAEKMPDDVARALRAVDPSGALLDTVKGAIRSSFTPDEILGFIKGKIPVTLEAELGNIARDLHIPEESLSVFMHESESWNSINDALRQSRNAQEFSGKATDILNDLRTRIERARTLQAQTTGTAVPEHIAQSRDAAVAGDARVGTRFVPDTGGARPTPPAPAAAPVAPKPPTPGVAPTGAPGRAIKSIEDAKVLSHKYSDYIMPQKMTQYLEDNLRWGAPEGEIRGVRAAVNKWYKAGGETVRTKLADSFDNAGEHGKTVRDALTEMWQMKANASYQLIQNPKTPQQIASRGWYENRLRQSDAMIRTIWRDAKGLDFEQLPNGPIDARMARGGTLETEGEYIREYYKRTQGAVPSVAPRGKGGGVQGTVEAGGGIRPTGRPEVPPTPGAGGAVGAPGALARGADPAAKSWLARETDTALRQWAANTDPNVKRFSDAARELLDERAAAPAGAAESAARPPSGVLPEARPAAPSAAAPVAPATAVVPKTPEGVARKIQEQLPGANLAYRGIQKPDLETLLNSGELTQKSSGMMLGSRGRGEIEVTYDLRKAMSDAGSDGVVAVFDKDKSTVQYQFKQAPQMKEGRISRDDIISAYNAKTGERFVDEARGLSAADKPVPLSYSRDRLGKDLDALVGKTDVSQKEVDISKALWDIRAEQAVASGKYKSVDEYLSKKLSEVTAKPGKAGRQLLQGTKGSTAFLEDGRAIMRVFDKGDISTVVHDSARVWFGDLNTQDLETIGKWAGMEGDDIGSRLADMHSGFAAMKIDRADQLEYTKVQEKFARGFEQYLRDGQAPAPELKGVFEQFKDWLTAVYRKITGSEIDIQVTPEVKNVFDRLLAEAPKPPEPVAATARPPAPAGRPMPVAPDAPRPAGITPEPRVPEAPPAPPEQIRPTRPEAPIRPPTEAAPPTGAAPEAAAGRVPPTPPPAGSIPDNLGRAIEDLRDAATENTAATGMQGDEAVAARYQIVADVLEQLYPRLDRLYNSPNRMDAVARQTLEKWVRGGLTGDMTDARVAAARIGDWYVQRNILNYSARTNLDDWLSWAFPFAYWPRATASNYLMEAMNRPALITSYMRSKQALDKIQEDEGFPKRFRGAIPVPMPFAGMAPWLSGKAFFDPLKDWLPIDRFTTEPAKNIGYTQATPDDIANEIRSQVQAGTLSAKDGEAALKQKKGNKLWDSIEKQMSQQRQPDPLDVGSLIFSPHFPLDWANKVMQGRPEDISYMIPMSRQIKGATAILGSAFPHLVPSALAGPEGAMGGLDPEGAIRQKLGLPAGDSTINYRIDRMLASMSLDGSITPDKARIAALERKGAVYDEAVRRTAIETGLGSLSGLVLFNARVMAGGEQIAINDAKEKGQLFDSLVKQAGGDTVKMSYDEQKKLLKDTKGDDGKPLWDQVSQWYKDHPEYKSRLELFDTAEGRLSNWLSDGIWDKYLALSALDRRLFSSQNPEFKEKFASKETRQKPQDIPNSMLEKWATLLGAYVPKVPSETPTSATSFDQVVAALQKQLDKPDQYRPQNPALAAKYDEYLSRYTVVSKTPEYQEYRSHLEPVTDVQTQYFALPAGAERKAFLQQHPELNEYWAWSRKFKDENPSLKEWFSWEDKFRKDNPELSKLLGWSVSAPATPYIPYTSSGGGGGYTPRQFKILPYRGGTGGRGGSAPGREKPWQDMVNELGGPNTPLVSHIEAWLTLEPGEGQIYASKNPDLAKWLSGKDSAYLEKLRASYLYRLHNPPLSIHSKKGYQIRYLRPIR